MTAKYTIIGTRVRRHRRVRSQLHGTVERPRLSIFKSNRTLYAQLIDDEKGATIASASSRGLKRGKGETPAKAVGEAIAKEAKSKKITAVVFDRGGFRYAGKIKALAEAARAEGLQF